MFFLTSNRSTDQYSGYFQVENLVTPVMISDGATGPTTKTCNRKENKHSLFRGCAWVGSNRADGKHSRFYVEVDVFPSSYQSKGSGADAAKAAAREDGQDLTGSVSVPGFHSPAYGGWLPTPGTAQLIFSHGNAEILVDFALTPGGAHDPSWQAHAESAAKKIEAAL
ncbi:hypothetical protein GCM10009765_66020 [Fodinicola feengrottensis]|uniref:Uncharacterized protein n=1 Tax=Fodinicola feengrottensis TaxID=435914 RepID=A0ABN2ILR8_9ACTN